MLVWTVVLLTFPQLHRGSEGEHGNGPRSAPPQAGSIKYWRKWLLLGRRAMLTMPMMNVGMAKRNATAVGAEDLDFVALHLTAAFREALVARLRRRTRARRR
jgi:hypothetical protein